MEGKKISFGFMKTKKVDKIPEEEKKEFIECLEEKSIKVVGGEIAQNNTPLVIPMKPNTLITAEKLQQIAAKVESALDEPETQNKDISVKLSPPENESIEQMAIRELIEDSKKEIKVETQNLTVSLSSKPVIDGQKESSLEDYESVPVQEFGMAMLRGMGWTPNKDQSKYKQPQLRPKGLGLGADKVITENQKKKDSKGAKNVEDLMIIKNAFVKITTGKYNGYYGKIVSLDEDNGRVVVDIPIKKETVSLSEFMMHPVSKSEYDKESKVINAESFEDYKQMEKIPQKTSKSYDKSGSSKETEYQKNTENKSSDRYDERRNWKIEKSPNGKSKKRSRRHSSSSDERARQRRRKEENVYSSNESLNSISDSDKKHKTKEKRDRSSSSESGSYKKKSKKKERRHHSSSSEADSYKKKDKKKEAKRDIDKKRKGKKKKRDRDRSPNYKKYRK